MILCWLCPPLKDNIMHVILILVLKGENLL